MPKRRSTWKDPVTREALERLACFSRLDEAALDAVVKAADGVRYDPENEIVTHGDVGGDVYFILEGRIRVETYTPRGKWITYDLLDAGMMFGELSAIDGKKRSASCITETEVHVARLSAESYNAILRCTPELADTSLQRLAGLVRHLLDKVYEFHAMPVSQRVLRRLLEIAEAAAGSANAVSISPGPTDEDIGSRAGTTREAVNREISELARSGIVRRRNRTLEFVDIAALRELVKQGG